MSVNGRSVAKIGRGLLVFLAVERKDQPAEADYLAEKVVNLRVFPDEKGRMNISVRDAGGELLVVSQFTLAGDCRKGRRPSFDRAEEPKRAEELYQRFIEKCRELGVGVKSGNFRATMDVKLVNSGPVTLLLSSRKEF